MVASSPRRRRRLKEHFSSLFLLVPSHGRLSRPAASRRGGRWTANASRRGPNWSLRNQRGQPDGLLHQPHPPRRPLHTLRPAGQVARVARVTKESPENLTRLQPRLAGQRLHVWGRVVGIQPGSGASPSRAGLAVAAELAGLRSPSPPERHLGNLVASRLEPGASDAGPGLGR
jgi:hypothetical protein